MMMTPRIKIPLLEKWISLIARDERGDDSSLWLAVRDATATRNPSPSAIIRCVIKSVLLRQQATPLARQPEQSNFSFYGSQNENISLIKNYAHTKAS